MIEAYRLHSSRYPASSGKGAAIRGGRWNRVGQEAIYTAGTRSLAALEVLAHYSVLPRDFVATVVRIPDHLIARVEESDPIVFAPHPVAGGATLTFDWQNDPELTAQIGEEWARAKVSAILSVPSMIIPAERNYILNPGHPQFREVEFLEPEPFHFDPRLKQSAAEQYL